MTTTPELLTAINDVMKAVGYVKKQSAQGLRYTYAGEAALLQALRPSMVKHGLTLIPVGVESSLREHGKARSGAMQWRVDGVWTFRLIHTSGGYVDVQAPGSGVDAGDKAAYCAATGALKYALRQTFLIETGDDPDRVASQAQEATPPAPHHKSWDADRSRFFAVLAEWDKRVTYDMLCAWVESMDQPRPSQLPQGRRDKLVAYITTNGGGAKLRHHARIDPPQDTTS